MKYLLLFVYFGWRRQVLIYARNDYQKPVPLTNALHYKAYCIETDVFLVKDDLMAAHTRP